MNSYNNYYQDSQVLLNLHLFELTQLDLMAYSQDVERNYIFSVLEESQFVNREVSCPSPSYFVEVYLQHRIIKKTPIH